MGEHEQINYVEFASRDIAASKVFFSRVFAWTFEDYGPDYAAFSNQGLDGGFYRSEHCSTVEQGGALIVFYSRDIGATQAKVEQAGGVIVKQLFPFPGGRRFHFREPGGNEFAVWSE
ncbi:VOC family protein [Mariprofundus ferrooxydans]|nr:VOC family protein [Mariprofundus ferrooxydans]